MKAVSTHAAAAKAIRIELKKAFPLTTFKVGSRTFSGGNAVDIEWINGPIYDNVMKLVNKYQYGHFNGMEDIYEMTNSRNDIPQVKYVQVRREVSQDIKEQVFEALKKTHAGFENLASMDEFSPDLQNKCGVYVARDFIYRITVKRDLTNGFNGVTIEP